MGETPRDLTLADALALLRSRLVERFAPSRSAPPPSPGQPGAGGECHRLHQRLSTRCAKSIWRRGRFLPAGDPERATARSRCSGRRSRRSSSAASRPVGRVVRIGDRRFRVIGILASGGESPGHGPGGPGHHPGGLRPGPLQQPRLFRILVRPRAAQPWSRRRRTSATIIRESARGRGRRHHHHPGGHALHLRPHPGGVDDGGGGDRRHQPHRRRGADHERDAGGGVPAHRGGRAAQGPGGPGVRSSGSSSPRPCCSPEPGPWAGWRSPSGASGLFNAQVEAFKLVAPAWAPLAAAGVSLGAGLLFGILPARRAARLDPVAALAGR
jgi:putative ABC transport system permease protein